MMGFLLNGGRQYSRDKRQFILIIVGATLINMQRLSQFKLKWCLGAVLYRPSGCTEENLSPRGRIDRLTPIYPGSTPAQSAGLDQQLKDNNFKNQIKKLIVRDNYKIIISYSLQVQRQYQKLVVKIRILRRLLCRICFGYINYFVFCNRQVKFLENRR